MFIVILTIYDISKYILSDDFTNFGLEYGMNLSTSMPPE